VRRAAAGWRDRAIDGRCGRIAPDREAIMTGSVFTKVTLARPRAAELVVVALAACGVALATTPAHAAGYSFETINDPAQPPFMGTTFTNLMGITSNGDTIPGFYGSGQAGDPNTGFVLTLPSKTFTPDNFPAMPQTQITAVNGNGTTFTGYTYPTNLGVPFDFQFGFYEKGGAFTMVNNPKTPDCSVSGACDSGVITENQLIGVNNSDLAVGFYNDRHGNSHGYTFDIATNTFSADINDPLAVSTVTAAINNSGEIAGSFTDAGFIDNGGVFSTVDPAGSTTTQLLGLNDNGLADGFAVIGGVQHGLLFDSLTDTFTILDPAGSTATTLNGINDRGEVVGFFVDAAGNTDGALGTPVPEPTTWVMVLAGFAGLGWLGLRQSRRPEPARAAS
jgi:PEP-CTERM motif-containing protein